MRYIFIKDVLYFNMLESFYGNYLGTRDAHNRQIKA